MNDQQTIQEFLKKYPMSISCKQIDQRPDNNEWKDADHWKCVLRNKATGKQMTFYYSKGYGHHGKEPNLCEVVSSMASDSDASEENFEDWCSNLGYDTDSRRAERIYKLCKEQTKKFIRVLGDKKILDELVYDTEQY